MTGRKEQGEGRRERLKKMLSARFICLFQITLAVPKEEFKLN